MCLEQKHALVSRDVGRSENFVDDKYLLIKGLLKEKVLLLFKNIPQKGYFHNPNTTEFN